MDYSSIIRKCIQERIQIENLILNDNLLLADLQKTAEIIVEAYRSGNKTLFCGNGGSAADAQHLAAELSGKFYLERDPIHAEACHTNSSFTTAVSNDYGFEMVYARYIQAVGKEGDVLVAISTSGKSENIIRAIRSARRAGMKCIVFTGQSGGSMSSLADVCLRIPSEDTPRIQESHILLGHIVCELVERTLFGNTV